MTTEHCPYCGSARFTCDGIPDDNYHCGTSALQGRKERSRLCFSKEPFYLIEKVKQQEAKITKLTEKVARQKEEIVKLKAAIKPYKDACVVMHYPTQLTRLERGSY